MFQYSGGCDEHKVPWMLAGYLWYVNPIYFCEQSDWCGNMLIRFIITRPQFPQWRCPEPIFLRDGWVHMKKWCWEETCCRHILSHDNHLTHIVQSSRLFPDGHAGCSLTPFCLTTFVEGRGTCSPLQREERCSKHCLATLWVRAGSACSVYSCITYPRMY